jgi:HSP20 family protein
MTAKGFPFDFEKVLDEAFRFTENFRESFDPQKAREAAERMRDGFCGGTFGGQTDFFPSYQYPPANFYLTPRKELVLELALAGFDEKDVSVQFRGDSLLFSAKAPQTPDDAGVQYFKRRLKMRDIEEQRYYVPTDRFDQGKAEAGFHNGLLRIVVPPRQEGEAQPGIRVSIRTGQDPR